MGRGAAADLFLHWPVGTGRFLTDEAIVVLSDSEKRQLLRAARDIGTIFLLCLPPIDANKMFYAHGHLLSD